jgi:fumarylacetoacetase
MFGPSRMLDVEVEVGFVTGDGPSSGTPIAIEHAEDHIFGLLLVNDWSARDIQSWEYQPLGPFLAKSFLTSVSPWVVPLRTLGPWRVDGPLQEPVPLPYLWAAEPRGVALDLALHLRTARMVDAGDPPFLVSSTDFGGMYWSMSQQLAHLTVNGATIRAGDLCASGTVSGSTPGSEGSLMERTWRGTRPLVLPTGEERGFLEDGDEVTITGRCGSIDFGSVVGTVVA